MSAPNSGRDPSPSEPVERSSVPASHRLPLRSEELRERSPLYEMDGLGKLNFETKRSRQCCRMLTTT